MIATVSQLVEFHRAVFALTVGRILFSVLQSVRIVIIVWMEERDLAAVFGKPYTDCHQQVLMLVPFLKK